MCERPRDPLDPDRPEDEPDVNDPETLQDAYSGGLDDWEIEVHLGDRDEIRAPELQGEPETWRLAEEALSDEWEAGSPSEILAEYGAPRCVEEGDGGGDALAADPHIQWEKILAEDRSRYGEYRRSPEWCRRRYDRHWLDEGICCRCGARAEQIWEVHRDGWNGGAPFHCHHVTYERCGRERSSDLRTLCCYCHIDIHRVGEHRGPMESKYGARPVKWPGKPLLREEWVAITTQGARDLWGDAGL